LRTPQAKLNPGSLDAMWKLREKDREVRRKKQANEKARREAKGNVARLKGADGLVPWQVVGGGGGVPGSSST